MDEVLAGRDNVIAYCDDILLFTKPEEHVKELDNLLSTLHNAGLVINRMKSQFMQTHMNFLGHKLSGEGIQPTSEKVEAIRTFPQPKTVRQVIRFLGMLNFYRRFLPNTSELQKPLVNLTCKKVEFFWSSECQSAFDELRNILVNVTMLVYPSSNDTFTLTTDASNLGVGGVLSCHRGPLGFYSKLFSKACLLYTSPSPRDRQKSRMPSSA